MSPQPISTLVIQNPGSTGEPGLLEAILEACDGAIYGAAAFAFASANGLRLVLDDEAFDAFVSEGAFDLILGVDAITDLRCLAAAQEILERRPNVSINVFLHNQSGVLFHPKTCWFRKPTGGTLITGSGNLTVGGLRSNWEAFTVTPLSNSQMDALAFQWQEWRRMNAAILLTPSDPRVLERAARNVGWEGSLRGRRRRRPEDQAEPVSDQAASAAETGAVAVSDPDEAFANAPALVAEIPRAGPRWRQANFDLATYEGFFGAVQGAQRRILLQHVAESGALGELESRPSIEVQSQNYRFELGGAPHVEYPDDGRPIAVFVRLPTGIFLYSVIMPSDRSYATIELILRARWSGRDDRVRRVQLSVSELRDGWPDSPLWLVGREDEISADS
jgi:hypothetical protein